MKAVTVYCASSPGRDPEYLNLATRTGKLLAEKNITVVYGGGRVGLMGALADGALQAGGKVIGVIPGFLRTKEVGHEGVTQLIEVPNMHERKLKMAELADAFITLPGGFGTLEELFETVTWGQLGLHKKPIGLVNHEGYYDHMRLLFDRMEKEGLLKSSYRGLILEAETPEKLLKKIQAYRAPDIKRWLDEQHT